MEWNLEEAFYQRGFTAVAGVDEAGRGPLAGPVAAAAVILPPYVEIQGLNDSKKLTPAKRDTVYEQVLECALAWAVALVPAQKVDEVNILQATFLAMKQALAELSVRADAVLVDGNRAFAWDVPLQTVVGGDAKSPSIAAASVVAKVTRDRYMLRLHEQYPQYGFAAHKGYGSKAHYQAIGEYGLCPEHRRTFLKNLEEKHGYHTTDR
ncbi:MAG: ribonuclease HII [Clostridia bacterium]|nr:ribonuclease HII [Clostridia bacterium]